MKFPKKKTDFLDYFPQFSPSPTPSQILLILSFRRLCIQAATETLNIVVIVALLHLSRYTCLGKLKRATTTTAVFIFESSRCHI